MKLIFCSNCHDLIRLWFDMRTCKCGRSRGRYKDDGLNAIVTGDAIPLGIDNQSLRQALASRTDKGQGIKFDAFVIPRKAPTIHGCPE